MSRRAELAQRPDVRHVSGQDACFLDPPPGLRTAIRRQEIVCHGRSGRRDVDEIHGDNRLADNGEPATAGRADRHIRITDIRDFDERHEFFETLKPCRGHK